MKNYDTLSTAYLAAQRTSKCYIKDSTGTPRLHLLTDAQRKTYEKRGVTVASSK
jgi:hypothetical protein